MSSFGGTGDAAPGGAAAGDAQSVVAFVGERGGFLAFIGEVVLGGQEFGLHAGDGAGFAGCGAGLTAVGAVPKIVCQRTAVPVSGCPA